MLAKEEAVALGRPSAAGETVYDAQGCALCGGSGYAGRMGVYEMMALDEQISELVASGASEGKIRDVARAAGMRSLRQDAADKVLVGLTSVAEALENTDGPALRKQV